MLTAPVGDDHLVTVAPRQARDPVGVRAGLEHDTDPGDLAQELVHRGVAGPHAAVERDLARPGRRAVRVALAIAEPHPGWSGTRRRQWTARTARRLEHGEIDDVMEDPRALCTGRNGKKIATEVAYFEERRERMRYDRFRQAGIPLGSGAMGSAVRRVVNLRHSRARSSRAWN